jgi:hypothetical protein
VRVREINGGGSAALRFCCYITVNKSDQLSTLAQYCCQLASISRPKEKGRSREWMHFGDRRSCNREDIRSGCAGQCRASKVYAMARIVTTYVLMPDIFTRSRSGNKWHFRSTLTFRITSENPTETENGGNNGFARERAHRSAQPAL